MATRNIGGFETGDTTDAVVASGTFSIQGTTTRGAWSAYALRTNPATSGAGYLRFTGLSDATGGSLNPDAPVLYHRFYFRYGTKPASNDEVIAASAEGTGTAANDLQLRLNSSGNLVAYEGNTPTLLDTGATVLSADTWYRIEMKSDVSDGINIVWEVKVNGSVEISGTTAIASGATTQNHLFLGKVRNYNSQSVDFYYDDWRISDSAYPGEGANTLLIPSANGSYQTWSIGAGAGSHYENVDEIPHDSDTTYLLSTGTTGNAETEAMGDTGSLSVTSVNSAKALAVLKRNGGTNGAIRLRSRSGSTDSDLGSNFATTSSYTLCAAIHDVDPATSSAWTTSGLDGVEVGCIERSANTSRLTFVGLAVDYVPASPPPPPPVVIPVLMNQYRQRWN